MFLYQQINREEVRNIVMSAYDICLIDIESKFLLLSVTLLLDFFSYNHMCSESIECKNEPKIVAFS